MKRLALISCLILSTCLSTGCQNYQMARGDREVVGTVLGGLGGGLIGSAIGAGTGQVIATGIGAVFGAMFGHEIGKSMDEADIQSANVALERAAIGDMGKTYYWKNPTLGHTGAIRPIRDGMYEGLYCREFQSNVYIDDRTERLYGTACRMRDGRWVAVRA